jgi:membrane protein DedA with SNARE-associated domain
MLVVGPLATLPAAFFAKFGVFNIWIVFFLSTLGNVVSNFFYFYLGRLGRITLIKRYGRYFGLHERRIEKIEKNLHNHSIKTIVAMKLLPFTVPALAIPGAMRMSLKRFSAISLSVIIPESIILVLLGYYSGLALDSLIKYFKNTEKIMGVVILIAILIWLVVRVYNRFIQKEFKDVA